MIPRIYRRAKSVSEVIGVAFTFIGLPAAILGTLAFSGEIRDTLTAPDVDVEVERMTLRCFYRFRDQRRHIDYLNGDVQSLIDNCLEAPLSISFTAEITNRDRIGRTVTGITADVDIAAAPGAALPFTRTWEVAHEIDGAAETSVRRNWYALELSPGRTTRHEVWIEQEAPESVALKWHAVRDWLLAPDRRAAAQPVTARIFVDVAGTRAPRHVATCAIRPAPDALDRYRALSPLRQIRFTASCAPPGPAT